MIAREDDLVEALVGGAVPRRYLRTHKLFDASVRHRHTLLTMSQNLLLT